MRARVLLADDHTMVADGIRASLEDRPEFEVVASVGDGAEAVEATRKHRPDLIVMDVSMPGLNGIEAARRIHAEMPDVKILFLSMHADKRFVTAALEAGAGGYLLKERAIGDLMEAIKTVLADELYLCPSVAGKLADAATRPATEPGSSGLSTLTSREREILQLIAEGQSTPRIAARLGLSVKTISTHRQNVMDKLDIHNVAGLTRYAVKHGLLKPDSP